MSSVNPLLLCNKKDRLGHVYGDAGIHKQARAAAKAHVVVYEAIRRQGTQKSVIPYMQTRDELYDVLGYHAYEQKLDELFGRQS